MELARLTLELCRLPKALETHSGATYKDCTGVLIIILETWRLTLDPKNPGVMETHSTVYRHRG